MQVAQVARVAAVAASKFFRGAFEHQNLCTSLPRGHCGTECGISATYDQHIESYVFVIRCQGLENFYPDLRSSLTSVNQFV